MPDIEATFDFNLHHRVGVRIVGAERRAAMHLARSFGLAEGRIDEGADIVIDRVDRTSPAGPMRTLGGTGTAFDDAGFFITRHERGRLVRTGIALDEIGEPGFRIIRDGPLSGVPLLRPILNLVALSKGLIPVHGAAFIHGGVGTLVTGWSRSGKTGALLTYMARGARYVAADWVYLDSNGGMHGSVEPVRVRQSHLDELPEYRDCLPASHRLRVRAIQIAADAYGSIPDGIQRRMPGGTRMGDRIAGGLGKRASADLPADRLFPGALAAGPSRLDRLLLTIAHEEGQIRVAPDRAEQMASRLASIVREASSELASQYLMFRYAFPERRSDLIETADTLICDALAVMLSGRDLRTIHHPYPVSPERFFDALESN